MTAEPYPTAEPAEPRVRTDDERPVLVTGATGFIGGEVVRRLAAAGVPTRAMFRRRSRAALVAPLPIELVMANLTRPESLRRAVDGCRAVIHLAGRATFESYDRIAPTLVDGTGSLAEAAAEAGVERFVYGSSLFVHGADEGVVADGSAPTDPVLDYGRAKLDAERLIADHHFTRGTVSVRLPHVYGAQDLLFGLLRRVPLPFPADMDGRFSHQHVVDAARTLLAAVDGEMTGPHPVADDEPVTWGHFFDVVETYLPSARIVRLPPKPVLVAAGLVEKLVPRGLANMVTADTIRGWNLDLQVKPGSMGAFGLSPRYPTVDSGIPAVFDAAVPYRWRHPTWDLRRA